jgi:hypothetical protein
MWKLMCEYKLRIADEAMRYNTISPPPQKHVWDETTRISARLGRFRSGLSMLIPDFVARRYAR